MVPEGAFAVVAGKGGAVTARAGDSVTFRNNIPTNWKQDGFLRKTYLTLRDPDGEVPDIALAEGGVTMLCPSSTKPVAFRNDTGNKEVRLLPPVL